MSQEKEQQEANQGPGMNESGFPPDVIPYVITFHKNTNRVDIAGPLQDKVLTYGVLEMAKEAVFLFHENVERNKKQQPHPEGSSNGKLIV